MPEMIDHVVLAVRDLTRASDDFRSRGFNVIPGGEHATRVSHNALVTFADGSYIEIIAFLGDEPQPNDPWWRMLQIGEGWVDCALYTPNLDEFIRKSNIEDLEGPLEGGRVRPDGQKLEWRTARLSPPPGYRLPFLIDDVTARELRVPGGESSVHPNGVQRLLGVTYVVQQVDAAAPLYGRFLGQEGERVETDLEGAGPALRYELGRQWVEIVEPADSASEISQHLEQRGPAPYEVTFGKGTSSGRGALLPLRETHGARLRIAE